MSTLAAAPTEFGAVPETTVQHRPAETSVFPLVITWALLFPLIFLAARGFFSFESIGAGPGGNYGAASTGSSEGASARHWTEVAIVFGIVLAATLPVCRSLARSLRYHWVLLLLPAWATASVLWSQYPLRSFVSAVQVIMLTLFGLYVPVRFSHKQQMQLFVLAGLATTLLSFATIALLPAAGIDRKNSTTGLQGIFPQKNLCALVTIELLTVAFCYQFKGKAGPLKRIMFVSLLTALILGTMARTGWIMLVLVVGFIALLKGLHRLRPLERFTVTWFLPAVSIAFGWLVYLNSAPILRLLGKDPTLSGRTGIWRVVFLAIVKRPLEGFGYGAFWVANAPEATRLAVAAGDPHLNNAENGVLQLWLELGLIGVLILLFVLFRSCRNAVICFRSNTPNYAIWYMSILFITMLSLVNGNKFMLWTSIEWMMFIMADVGLANEARRIQALQAATRTTQKSWA